MPKINHPLHPVLVHFPVAFLLGSSACHVAFIFGNLQNVWEVSVWLLSAGVVTGVITAMAGAYDFYKYIISRSKKDAYEAVSRHIMFVMAAMLIYSTCLIYIIKIEQTDISAWILLSLSLSGAATLLAGGFFGGEIIYNHMVSYTKNVPDQRQKN